MVSTGTRDSSKNGRRGFVHRIATRAAFVRHGLALFRAAAASGRSTISQDSICAGSGCEMKRSLRGAKVLSA